MKIRFSLLFLFITVAIGAQTNLTISGKTYSNSDDTWLGVNIPRDKPTALIFKNNSITSVNRYGYMLQAGDEASASTNNNLDGAVITGNKFSWSGSDMTVITHGLFTGHNKNVVAKYNYLKDVPMGIIRKSSTNMSNTGGGVAYNIVKNGAVAMVIKGMSNVNVYNNTFYTERTSSQTWRPLLNIYTNTDNGNYSVAHGTRVFNNIFYMKYQTFAITLDDAESLNGLECDYNVYWCEAGAPKFKVNGSVKSFSEWQAMGYDAHSVVMNPEFKDLVNFVPSKRLDFGKDLGTDWKDGLAIDAVWGTADPATTSQNGLWQVGAVVYPEAATAAGTPVAPVVPTVQPQAPVTQPVQPPAPVVQPVQPQAPVAQTGSDVTNPAEGTISVSPNLVHNSLTIGNIPGSVQYKIDVYDFNGKLCLEKTLEAAQSQVIPVNLNPGIYIAYIEKGEEIVHFMKLIVVQ